MSFTHATKVKIDKQSLRELVDELHQVFVQTGAENLKITAMNKVQRSAHDQWNNCRSLLDKLDSGELFSDGSVIDVVGSAKGNSARVYYKPSVTSLTKQFRRCVKPINEDNVIVYFDLRAAEFAMNAIFAQEVEAVQAYQRGEDIYMHYADLFPQGTERKVIKKILIANMYNQRAYSVSKDLGISEMQAQRLLDMVAARIPRMTMLKRRIIAYARRNNGYFCPRGFDQTNLIKIADVDPAKGFNPDFALSAYTQSALGFFMQAAIEKLSTRTTGMLLTVFDSMFVEIKPESLERFKKWALREMAPLIPDEFNTGKTMWEAAYETEN